MSSKNGGRGGNSGERGARGNSGGGRGSIVGRSSNSNNNNNNSGTGIEFGSTWQSLSRLPSRRQYYAMAVIASTSSGGRGGGNNPSNGSIDRVALVGGHDPSLKAFLDTVAVYDTVHDEWNHYKLRVKRRFCAAVAVDQRVYVFGGYNDADRVLNSCEMIDLSTTMPQSVDLPTMKEKRQGCAAVTILNNKFVVVMGGNDGQNAVGSMEILDVQTLQWTNQRLPQLLEKRFYLAAASAGPYVVVAGGYGHGGSGKLSSCEILDMRNKRWQKGWRRFSDMSCPRYHCGGAAITSSGSGGNGGPGGGTSSDGRSFALVVAGGVGTRTVEVYDSKSKAWRELPPLLEMSSHRQVAVMGSNGSSFIVAAGETSLEWLPRTDNQQGQQPQHIVQRQGGGAGESRNRQLRQQSPHSGGRQPRSSVSPSPSNRPYVIPAEAVVEVDHTMEEKEDSASPTPDMSRARDVGGGGGGPHRGGAGTLANSGVMGPNRTSYQQEQEKADEEKTNDSQDQPQGHEDTDDEDHGPRAEAIPAGNALRSTTTTTVVEVREGAVTPSEAALVTATATPATPTAIPEGSAPTSSRDGAGAGADASHVAVTQWNDIQFGSVWKSMTKLPTRRQYYALAAIGNRQVAVVGGHDPTSKSYLDTVDVYNTETEQWTSFKMLTKRRFCAAVAIDARVFIFGGHNDTNRHLASCEVLDTRHPERPSLQLPPMRFKRQGCAAVAVYDNRYIIVMGGNDGRSVLASVEILDVRTLQWKRQQLPSMLEKRFYLAAASSGPFILVAGGYGKGRLASAEILDVRTGHWQKGWERFPDMQIARYHCGGAAISLSNKSFTMVVAGGVGTKSVEAYDSKTQTWFPLPAMEELSCHRQLELLGEQLVAAGESSLECLDLAVNGTLGAGGPGMIARAAMKEATSSSTSRSNVAQQQQHLHVQTLVEAKIVPSDGTSSAPNTQLGETETATTATLVTTTTTPSPPIAATAAATADTTDTTQPPQHQRSRSAAVLPPTNTQTQQPQVGPDDKAVVETGRSQSSQSDKQLSSQPVSAGSTVSQGTSRSSPSPRSVSSGSNSSPAPTPEFGQKWVPLTKFDVQRQYYALAAVGNDQIAVVGGHNVSCREYLDTVDVWDVRNNSWSSFQMKERRRFCAAVAIGTRVFVFGGHNSEDRQLDSAEVINIADPDAKSERLPHMRDKRQGCSAVAVYENRYIVVLGGNDGQNVLSTVEIFDVQKMQWRRQQLPPMVDKRYYLSGATAGPYILVAGGFGGARLATTEMLDMRSGRWKDGWRHFAPMKMERYHCGSITLGSSGEFFTLVVAGGVGTRTVEAYESATDTWFALPDMIAPSSHRELVQVGNFLVAGGESSIEALSFKLPKESMISCAANSNSRSSPQPRRQQQQVMEGPWSGSQSISTAGQQAQQRTVETETSSTTSSITAWTSDEGSGQPRSDRTEHVGHETPFSEGRFDVFFPTEKLNGKVGVDDKVPSSIQVTVPGVKLRFGNVWKPLTSLCSRRQYYAFANVGMDRLAIIGGHDPATKTYLNSVVVYNIRTMTWTPYKMRKRRRFCAAVAVENRIFVFGGHNGTDRHLSSAEMIDLDNPVDGSKALPSMKNKRQGCAAVAVWENRYIVVLGGNDGTNALSAIEIFDVRTLRWRTQQLPSMLEKRYYLAAAAAGPYILVAGGFGSGRLSSAELLNISTGAKGGAPGWKAFCNMKLARYHCGGMAQALANNSLTMVVAGGVGTRTVETYDSVSDSWSSLPALHSSSCHRHLVFLGDRLVAAGESSLEFLEAELVPSESMLPIASETLSLVESMKPDPAISQNGGEPSRAMDKVIVISTDSCRKDAEQQPQYPESYICAETRVEPLDGIRGRHRFSSCVAICAHLCVFGGLLLLHFYYYIFAHGGHMFVIK